MPPEYRPFLEHGVYLLPGPDGQLECYTPEGYDEQKRQRTSGEALSRDARRRNRSFFGRLRRLELDRQGRITIPQQMREDRGLDGAAVIVGMGEYLEIWNADAWEAEQSELDGAYAELLQGLADALESSQRTEDAS